MKKLHTTPSEEMIEEAGEVKQNDGYEISITVKINDQDVIRKLRYEKIGSELVAERVSIHAYEMVENLFKEL